MKIYTATMKIDDARTSSIDELEEIYHILHEEVTSMTIQVEHAGEKADPDWLRRIKLAIGHRKVSINTLERLMGRKKRQENAKSGETFAKLFVEQARGVITRQEFNEITANTRQEFQTRGEN